MSSRSVQASTEQQLHDHNIELPPIPRTLGAYVKVVQTENLLFLIGSIQRDLGGFGKQSMRLVPGTGPR